MVRFELSPPQHPRFAGIPYDYHYLSSLTSAALVKVGLGLTSSLTSTSFVFSVLTLFGLFAFVRRLTGDRNVAALTMVLFFLGGTLGWLLIASDFNHSHNLSDLLLHHAWDQGRQSKENYEWQNVYLANGALHEFTITGTTHNKRRFTISDETPTRTGETGTTVTLSNIIPHKGLSTLIAP